MSLQTNFWFKQGVTFSQCSWNVGVPILLLCTCTVLSPKNMYTCPMYIFECLQHRRKRLEFLRDERVNSLCKVKSWLDTQWNQNEYYVNYTGSTADSNWNSKSVKCRCHWQRGFSQMVWTHFVREQWKSPTFSTQIPKVFFNIEIFFATRRCQ